ncbi:MAG: methyltransferase domain-containing protein [Pseudomonadota bacterium]
MSDTGAARTETQAQGPSDPAYARPGPAPRRVLHVGCGGKGKDKMPGPFAGPGWEEIRFDIDPGAKPDILGTATDMSAVETGSMDAIYTSHTIEHVFHHEVAKVVAEFVRVLHPERGFAVVTCPDLQALGEAIAAGKLEEPLYQSPAGPITPLDILYGHRASVARGQVYMAHKTGFTTQSLLNALARNGFATSAGIRRLQRHEAWAIGFRWRADQEEKKAFRIAYLPR